MRSKKIKADTPPTVINLMMEAVIHSLDKAGFRSYAGLIECGAPLHSVLELRWKNGTDPWFEGDKLLYRS